MRVCSTLPIIRGSRDNDIDETNSYMQRAVQELFQLPNRGEEDLKKAFMRPKLETETETETGAGQGMSSSDRCSSCAHDTELPSTHGATVTCRGRQEFSWLYSEPFQRV